MKQLFWLTLIMGVFCLASVAQQADDSASNPLSTQVSQPPVFSDFNYSIKDVSKVLLQWTIDSGSTNDYFIVEHGKDTAHFETLSVLKRADAQTQYEMIDNNALSGFNYYRIKCMDSAGVAVYSKILQVSSGKTDFKFYPNPADKILIVETDHFSELQIINAMGSILMTKQLQTGVQIVNISALEKGDYIIRATDRANNKAILEHLLKN